MTDQRYDQSVKSTIDGSRDDLDVITISTVTTRRHSQPVEADWTALENSR